MRRRNQPDQQQQQKQIRLSNPYLRPTEQAGGAAGGDQWNCDSCNFKNKGSNQVCGGSGPLGCKKPNPHRLNDMLSTMMASGDSEGVNSLFNAMVSAEVAARGSSPSFGGKGGKGGKGSSAEWKCDKCNFKNKSSNAVCGGVGPLGCKTPREGSVDLSSSFFNWMPGMTRSSSMSSIASSDGRWTCECGFVNRSSNDMCGGAGPMGCKKTRSLATSAAPNRNDLWVCKDCGFKNRSTNTVCGGAGPMGCKKEAPDRWICECGFINQPGNTLCGGSGDLGCNAPRPAKNHRSNNFL
eukprot:TRINITY_DN56058_c0_g1_i1.p1 TRINITY_DN56058_c0_g1~~TRINITY_DN56058_c0_g1_i1.p1  ORF type:complete len:328 (-),score=29.78 TRINITY_DN56058_c0_g1_i1:92-976(-)